MTKFSKSNCNFIKNLIPQIIPDFRIGNEEINIIDFYNSKNEKENKLVTLYKKIVIVKPKIPTINSKGKNDCLQAVQKDNHILITSSLITYQHSTLSEIVHEWDFNTQNIEVFFKNIKLNSPFDPSELEKSDQPDFGISIPIEKFNNMTHIYTIIICVLDQPYNGNLTEVLNKNSIVLEINLVNPNKMLCTHYLHHDMFKLCFFNEKASQSRSESLCICKLQDLGTDKCPYEKYINKKSNQQLFQEISDELYDNKESFQEGKYLQIMNNLKELQENIK